MHADTVTTPVATTTTDTDDSDSDEWDSQESDSPSNDCPILSGSDESDHAVDVVSVPFVGMQVRMSMCAH